MTKVTLTSTTMMIPVSNCNILVANITSNNVKTLFRVFWRNRIHPRHRLLTFSTITLSLLCLHHSWLSIHSRLLLHHRLPIHSTLRSHRLSIHWLWLTIHWLRLTVHWLRLSVHSSRLLHHTRHHSWLLHTISANTRLAHHSRLTISHWLLRHSKLILPISTHYLSRLLTHHSGHSIPHWRYLRLKCVTGSVWVSQLSLALIGSH